MNTLLMESITEVQQIVAECNTELIVIEASESNEEVKEEKKKSTLKEKIKKAWDALKSFVSKWWNAFIDMIKKNKAVILNGKKEVEYKDYESTVKELCQAIKKTVETGKLQSGINHQDTKKGTVKEAVKALEKCAAELKKAIDSAKPEKGEKEIEDVTQMITFAQSVLSQIQAELKRVVAEVGGKTKEATEESFVSVLDESFVSVLEDCDEDDEDCDDEDEEEDDEEVEESFMAEAAEIFYENVSLLEHQDYVRSALEVFEIMTESDVLIESESEEKKKSSMKDKVKRAWDAFIGFFKKWWNKFLAFLSAIKKKITQFAKSKTKKIEYTDYSGVLSVYLTSYKKYISGSSNTSKISELIAEANKKEEKKTAVISKAVAILDKQGKNVNDFVNKINKEVLTQMKMNEVPAGMSGLIDALYSLLSKIQTEATRVANEIGMEYKSSDLEKKKKSKKR